jgi:hypothetical protein
VVAQAAALVPWAWGINGFCAVIGTAVAVLLGMACGGTAMLVRATLCDGIALVVMLPQTTPLPVEE